MQDAEPNILNISLKMENSLVNFHVASEFCKKFQEQPLSVAGIKQDYI